MYVENFLHKLLSALYILPSPLKTIERYDSLLCELYKYVML